MTGGAAAVIGANGGIGRALLGSLRARGTWADAIGLARTPGPDGIAIDVEREDAVREAAAVLAARLGARPLRLVIVATGVLHAPGIRPERRFADLDPDALATLFRVNATGPALCFKHLLPLLPRDGRTVFACLSARVGSIGDNALGGWTGYRASKAALNMIVRNAAIELARTHHDAICVALHPGTVATALSAPFRANIPSAQLRAANDAADALLSLLDRLGPNDSGRCFATDGSTIVP